MDRRFPPTSCRGGITGTQELPIPAHSKAAKPSGQIAVIGGKNVFYLIGLDKCGAIVLKAEVSRSQLENHLANLPSCLIGMEAGVGSHHLSRRLMALGHDARLMPAQYVKPFLKGHKNDYRDAEAVAEAVQRPTMRFVAAKRQEQLDGDAERLVHKIGLLPNLFDKAAEAVLV